MIQKFTLESHHDRLLLQGLLVLPEQKPPRRFSGRSWDVRT